MSNEKTSNGTKCQMEIWNEKICVNIFGFLLLLSDYMYNNVEKMVKNVENVRGNVCI
jgi:hypothetical protein